MDYQTEVQDFENNSKKLDDEKQLLPLSDLQLAFVGGGSGDVIHG